MLIPFMREGRLRSRAGPLATLSPHQPREDRPVLLGKSEPIELVGAEGEKVRQFTNLRKLRFTD